VTTLREEETIRKVSTKLKVLLPSSREIVEECKKTNINALEDPAWIFCSVQVLISSTFYARLFVPKCFL